MPAERNEKHHDGRVLSVHIFQANLCSGTTGMITNKSSIEAGKLAAAVAARALGANIVRSMISYKY